MDLQTDDTDDESYEEMGINCDGKDFEDPVWTDSEPGCVSETMEDDYFETEIANPGYVYYILLVNHRKHYCYCYCYYYYQDHSAFQPDPRNV